MTNWTLDENRRCRAHSSQHGDQCRQHAIRGGTVCVTHGGRAPQVKQAAAERLQELVDPAITRLAQLLESGESDMVKLATARDILDRAGYKPKERIDLNVQTVKAIDAAAWESV